MKSKEFIRGTIRTIVLKLLSDKKRMYGYEITQHVAELSKDQIKLTYGALYPILYKLEDEGLLVTSTEIVANRARKYYSLTPKGKEIAIEKVSELQKFAETLKIILRPNPSANLSPVLLILLSGLIFFFKQPLPKVYLTMVIAYYMWEYPIALGFY